MGTFLMLVAVFIYFILPPLGNEPGQLRPEGKFSCNSLATRRVTNGVTDVYTSVQRYFPFLEHNEEFVCDWETIRKNIKISAKKCPSYCELKKHKPWFDKGCSKLVDQRKDAKLLCYRIQAK
jgi:hypothetical protein